MDIPSNKQLVPFYPRQHQLAPYTPKSSRAVKVSGYSVLKEYDRLPPPIFSGYDPQPDPHESAYNSSRQRTTPKINQIGLLIDIYA
jgi:hypothetical protein